MKRDEKRCRLQKKGNRERRTTKLGNVMRVVGKGAMRVSVTNGRHISSPAHL